MTFSDDDLKRLKEKLCEFDPCYHAAPPHYLSCSQIRPLLARLKAAEKIVEDTKLGHGNCICTHCAGNYEAWRKAAGK